MVEYLRSKHEALSSNLNTIKRKPEVKALKKKGISEEWILTI
jgi:hypothetical protein